MSSQDLEKELSELKSELFKLRFSLATNGLDNPLKVKEVRKNIARVKANSTLEICAPIHEAILPFKSDQQ